MIIILILIGVFTLFLVWFITTIVVRRDSWDIIDPDAFLSLIGGILSLGALVICGIVMLVTNGYNANNVAAINYNRDYDKLTTKEQSLHLALVGDLGLTVEESATVYHVFIENPIEIKAAIDDYNCSVIDFKSKIYTQKVQIENPWINWFINHGVTRVKNYNPDATCYEDVLGDSLKTFEFVTRNAN